MLPTPKIRTVQVLQRERTAQYGMVCQVVSRFTISSWCHVCITICLFGSSPLFLCWQPPLA
jgi:hypothetical protein